MPSDRGSFELSATRRIPEPRLPLSMAYRSEQITLRGYGKVHPISAPSRGGWAFEIGDLESGLRSITIDRRDDLPDSVQPVALAAFPFDRGRAAPLLVPERLDVARSSGVRFTQTFQPPPSANEETERPTAVSSPSPRPERVTITAERDPDSWCGTVAEVVRRVHDSTLQKAVIFRSLLAERDTPFDPCAVYEHMSGSIPGGYAYFVDGFVGVSPELLISRTADVARAQPMAGTLPLTGVADQDTAAAARLMADPKMLIEHQITIDRLHDALLGWCSYLDAEPHPSVVRAASVQHLATRVEGRLSHPPATIGELVAALHPTPAVGGWPVDEALATIVELEGIDRGRAGGPVGWLDAGGDGEFAVGIRCAEFDGTTARLFAGVGVVADSDPAEEFAETQAKFRTVLPTITSL